MAATGTRFVRGGVPSKLERITGADGKPRIRVTFRLTEADADGKPVTVVKSEDYDTVVWATGRSPATGELGLQTIGIALDASGKVVGGGPAVAAAAASSAGAAELTGSVLQRGASASIWSETTSVPSVHALGDVLAGTPELTPVAIKAGKLLARRILAGLLPTDKGHAAPLAAKATTPALTMRYELIPTTVFTPLEYGAVGLSEQAAMVQYGADAIDVYHLAYDTLELAVAHRVDRSGMPMPPQCYSKLIVTRGATPADERILGLHVLGPNAGEVVQGFAVAMRMGATRADLEATVGIHPTHAEELVGLDRSKRSGASFTKTSC